MRIGEIEIKNGICLAPLAGVSDRTFRRMARRFGAEYTVSEMVSAKALCYEQRSNRASVALRSKTAPLAAVRREELPMAVQIFGSEPEFMQEAARLLVSNEYKGCQSEVPPSVIDINMGCPMAKIVGNGEGSALMKNPRLAAEIVSAVRGAVSVPVTVKFRAGWDASSVNAVEFAKRMEDAGASMICVHGRTREQMYTGKADWEIIRQVKDAVSVPVLGNGDVFSAADALRMIEVTGCDGIMVARGAQGNPWIFSEILSAMEGKKYTPPTWEQRLAVALEHAKGLVLEKGEHVGVAEARKHLSWYLHGGRGSAAARNAVMQASTLAELEQILDTLRDLA